MPQTIATARDAVATFALDTVADLCSTALTRTSAGDAATGTSGGGRVYFRIRHFTIQIKALATITINPRHPNLFPLNVIHISGCL
jgi:hypothetical protein